MNSKMLIEYIKTCYELEKSIYLQSKVIETYKQKVSYYKDYKSKFASLYNCNRKTIPREYDIYVSNPVYKQGLYTGCSSQFAGWEKEKPHSSDEVIIYINATRDMKFGLLQTSRSKALKKLETYNEALKKANDKIIVKNEMIKKDSMLKVNMMEIELENEKKRLISTKVILQGFYDKDIIFIKYRSFVVISAILEYMMSGRCATLSEAYNKYEEELRQSIIIDKLELIIDRLERIEKSQYMLYDAIIDVNSQLSEISSGLDSALSTITKIGNNIAASAHNSKVISDNVAVSTYNSKIIADNEIFQSKLLALPITST